MRITRKVNAADRVVIIALSGDIGDQDLLSVANELENDPEVRSDYSLLIDLRQADGRNVTRNGVRALAARDRVLSPKSRRGVLVLTSLGFGMARMYEMLRGEDEVSWEVFRDFDEAERWVTTGVR